MKNIILLVAVLSTQVIGGQEGARLLAEAAWQNDLSWLVHKIEETHPHPWGAISQTLFDEKVDALKHDLPHVTDSQFAARMMQLVALLRDGHSTLEPVALNRWFPIRCYVFTDGLFITAIGREYRDAVGSRVLSIGNRDPKEVLALCASLKGANNEFGDLENGVLYLANADLLQALGVSDPDGELTLQVKRPDGNVRSLTLAPQTVEKQTNWMEWGEMYGPVPDLATFFGGKVSGDYRKGEEDLPLHLRRRLPFWFDYLSGSKTVYFQFNFVEREWSGMTFQQFSRQLFSFIDTSDVVKLVIDLRYNSGGDGSILDPFLHEIIKRDKINQKGRLFVMVGRKTFSAAVLFLGSLKRHTNAYFVGEPAGAPLNHYGEPQRYVLPSGKFILQLSTLYYQAGNAADRSPLFPIDFPSQLASSDYFSGKDPALEFVLANTPRTVCDMLLENPREGMKTFERASALSLRFGWYTPFTETDMNSTGYKLLEAGQGEAAVEAFLLNARTYPASWNVWDSLAEAYLKEGNTALAIQYYRKSLGLNPGNDNARDTLDKLAHAK